MTEMTKLPVSYIRIYEDWNQDDDGNIWYRWRYEGEKQWRVKMTPYKEKPIIKFKYVSPQELGRLEKRFNSAQTSPPNNVKGSNND